MAKAEMNSKWWLKNKALTLTDKGDSVDKALKAFAAAVNKSPPDPNLVSGASKDLSKACAALKAKANKLLHKDTIKYLDTYINNCAEATANLDKADGQSLMKNLYNMPRAMMNQLKELDKTFWVTFEENLLFLNAMKGRGGKGSKELYETYIKNGAAHKVNIPAAEVKDIEKAGAKVDDDHPDGDWENQVAWSAAVKTIVKMVKDASTQNAPQLCKRVEQNMQIEAIKNMLK